MLLNMRFFLNVSFYFDERVKLYWRRISFIIEIRIYLAALRYATIFKYKLYHVRKISYKRKKKKERHRRLAF